MHNVFLSYGRGSTGRAVAPPSAPTPQFGEVRRGRNAAHVADFSRVTRRVPRRQRFKAKTAFRMGGLKRREILRTYQSAKAIGRRGLCFVGTLAAVPGGITLRAVSMPASNPTLRMVRTLSPGGGSCGRCAIRARVGTCVPLARHGTAHPARARFWQWKVFWARGLRETRRCAPRKRQSRWRG